jgi:hypothetical protein
MSIHKKKGLDVIAWPFDDEYYYIAISTALGFEIFRFGKGALLLVANYSGAPLNSDEDCWEESCMRDILHFSTLKEDYFLLMSRSRLSTETFGE